MTLDTLDWTTITQAQARRLRVAAAAREKAIGRKFEADEVTTCEFLAAGDLEIDLEIHATNGVKEYSKRPEGRTRTRVLSEERDLNGKTPSHCGHCQYCVWGTDKALRRKE